MKILSGKEFAKLLEKHGWVLKSAKGSHHIYMKKGQTARLSVPIHSNKSLKIGLMRHMMKIAGITESDL
ncbi:MAG: type II toxin-antitoxin system HicA family toxin [SAR324 cluster bacterium]|nr:type II toxin-antitoxin system HicA family toxin [SAR324 cluster bacterium]